MANSGREETQSSNQGSGNVQSEDDDGAEEPGTVAPKKKRTRDTTVPPIAKACTVCAKRKTRCPGGQPCTVCVKAGVDCEYKTSQRRGPKQRKPNPYNEVLAMIQGILVQAASGSDVRAEGTDPTAALPDNPESAPLNHVFPGAFYPPLPSPTLHDGNHLSTFEAPSSQLSLPRPATNDLGSMQIGQPPFFSLPHANTAIPHSNWEQPQKDAEPNQSLVSSCLSLPISLPPILPAVNNHEQNVTPPIRDTAALPSILSMDKSQPDRLATPVRSLNQAPYLPPSNSLALQASTGTKQAIDGRDKQSGTDSSFAARLYNGGAVHLNHYSSMLPQDLSVSDTANSSEASPHPRVPSLGGISPQQTQQMHTASPLADYELQSIGENPATVKVCYQLYFAFVHNLWPLLYRPLFDPIQTQNHTPALHYSIMAIASRTDVAKQLQDTDYALKSAAAVSRLGEYYIARAKAALDATDFASSLRNVQALILMALRELAQGRTRLGWMYSGMAIRMAYDLQLHQPTRIQKDQVQSDSNEQEVRRVIWTCYCLDKNVSLMLGRPFMMKAVDIETPFPSIYEADEYSYWHEDIKLIIPRQVHLFSGVRSKCMTTLISWARLMVIVDKVMETFYGYQRCPPNTAVDKLVELNNALDNWVTESAEVMVHLQALRNAPTHIVLVLLWHYACRIMLNRPFIPSNPLVQTPSGEKTVHLLCTEAADAISIIVEALDNTFGIYRCPHSLVFIVFQAGIMHLANSTVKDLQMASRGHKSLNQCIAWLDEIATAYACSPQYRQVLSSLEEMSKRELREKEKVTEILASRLASRAASPNLEQGLQAFVDGNDSSSNPLSNFHYSFWDMPLSLPIDNSDLASWKNWQLDYNSLLLDPE